MKILVFKVLFIWTLLFLDQKANLCFAQDNGTNSIVKLAQAELLSTNESVKFYLAGALGQYHSKSTFVVLLKLLAETNQDISYAAAMSIKARKDTNFSDELVMAIKRLPRDSRWPAYSAAASYPTLGMFDFLLTCLDEEIVFQKTQKIVNCDNCFYLAKGLDQILHDIGRASQIEPPVGEDIKEYQQFAQSLKTFEPMKGSPIRARGQ
jgi:hypothetical protein